METLKKTVFVIFAALLLIYTAMAQDRKVAGNEVDGIKVHRLIVIDSAEISSLTVKKANCLAQKGIKTIGGNLIFGTSGSMFNYHFGFGGKFLYNITNSIRLDSEFDFFPKKDYLSWWDFSVYGHCLISVGKKAALYPSIGLGIAGVRADLWRGETVSASGFSFSFGGGFDRAVASNLVISSELRFKIHGSVRLANFTVGLAYMF